MVYTIPEYVSWFPFGEDVVLLDTRIGKRSQLKDAGAHLWREIRDGATEASLVESLVPLADGSAGDARDYVREWARSLQRARLLYPPEDPR